MSKLKKVLTILLIITVLLPLLPLNISLAEDSAIDAQVIESNTDNEDEKNIEDNKENDVETTTSADDDEARRAYLGKYVRTYVKIAVANDYVIYDKKNLSGYWGCYFQNEWPINKIGFSGTKETGSYSNKIVCVCSVFSGSMLHQAWDADILGHYDDLQEALKHDMSCRGSAYSDPLGRGKGIFRKVELDEPLEEGDIFLMAGHSAIYIGRNPDTGVHEFAETGGFHAIHIRTIPNSATLTYMTPKMILDRNVSSGECYFIQADRILPEKLTGWKGVPKEIRIQWPDGTTSVVDPNDLNSIVTEYDDTLPLYYSGLGNPVGTLGTQNRIKDILKGIWNGFLEIINYAVGMPALALRIPFVGLAHFAEDVVSASAQIISEDNADRNITLEKIIFNKVPMFDINIFEFNEAGGKPLENDTEGENVITTIRKNIAGWYVSFRNLVIAVLFVILIYLGIRMALTNIAEEKAHYKRMLVDWLVSFVIVLFIHFFLLIVFTLNDYLIELLSNQSADIGSVYDKVREFAYSSIKFTEGWYGTVMYIALVWFMIKYAWKYAKRMLTGYILIMLSPLVAISYALDKIRDNKAQSLGKWMKEVIYTVLIQTVHCLIYVTFVSGIIARIIANGNNFLEVVGVTVFLIIAIKFMETAENIFKTIFGFESSSILKEVMSSSFEMFVKFKFASKVLKNYFKFGRYGLKATGKVAKFAGKGVGYVARPVGKGAVKLGYKVAPTLSENVKEFKDRKLERVGSLLDDVAGQKLEIPEDSTTNPGLLAQLYQKRRDTEQASYSGKIRETYNLEKQIISNTLQGTHFIFDEGTSALSGVTKLLVAGMAGARLTRIVSNELRRREKRNVRVPHAPGVLDGSGKLTGIDKKNYSAQNGLKARFRSIVSYNRGQRLIANYIEADRVLTESLNILRPENALGKGATQADRDQVVKNTFGIITEMAKTPTYSAVKASLVNSSAMHFTTRKNGETIPIKNTTMRTAKDAYGLVEATLREQRNSATPRIIAENRKMFGKKYKRNIEAFIVNGILGKGPTEKISFSGDFKEKFEKTEQKARQEAQAMGYNKQKTAAYVQKAIKADVHKILDKDSSRDKLLKELGDEKLITIASQTKGGLAVISPETVRVAVKTQKPIISEATFTRKYKKEVEAFVVEKVLGNESKDKLSFSGEFKEKFDKTEKEARAKAQAMGYTKKQTDTFVQRALKDEVHNIMEDDEAQGRLLEQIDTKDLTVIAAKVASDMKTLDGNKPVKVTQSELKNIVEKYEESGRAETLIKGAIDSIEELSGVRVDREKVMDNIQTALEDVYVHKATGDAETLEVVFGKDLSEKVAESKEILGKKLTDKKLTEIKEKYSLSDEQVADLRDDKKSQTEKHETLVRHIVHNAIEAERTNNTGAFTQRQNEAIMNLGLDGTTNLLTRALNMEGSVERKQYSKDDLLKTVYGDKQKYSSDMSKQIETLQVTLKNMEATQRAATQASLRLGLPDVGDIARAMQAKHSTNVDPA